MPWTGIVPDLQRQCPGALAGPQPSASLLPSTPTGDTPLHTAAPPSVLLRRMEETCSGWVLCWRLTTRQSSYG